MIRGELHWLYTSEPVHRSVRVLLQMCKKSCLEGTVWRLTNCLKWCHSASVENKPHLCLRLEARGSRLEVTLAATMMILCLFKYYYGLIFSLCSVCLSVSIQAAEVERQLSTQVHSLRDDFREKSMSTSQHMTRLETLQAEVSRYQHCFFHYTSLHTQ